MNSALCTIGDSPPHRRVESRHEARRARRRIGSLSEIPDNRREVREGMALSSTIHEELAGLLGALQWPTSEVA